MNNKGFGLQELLVFIGIFLFILVGITIYWNAKIGNESFYDEPDIQIEETNSETDAEPIEIEKPEEYINIENNLADVAKNYPIDKSDNKVITLKQLQDNKLVGNIYDPHDKNVLCKGYVVYTVSNNKYKAYINCNGMYATESYDNKLEN